MLTVPVEYLYIKRAHLPDEGVSNGTIISSNLEDDLPLSLRVFVFLRLSTALVSAGNTYTLSHRTHGFRTLKPSSATVSSAFMLLGMCPAYPHTDASPNCRPHRAFTISKLLPRKNTILCVNSLLQTAGAPPAAPQANNLAMSGTHLTRPLHISALGI